MTNFSSTFAKTLGFLSAIVIIIFLIFFTTTLLNKYLVSETNGMDFIEGDNLSLNKIILINLNGPIIDQTQNKISFLNSEIIYVNEVEKILKNLSDQKSIKGLLLSFNSPGGSVSGSNRLYKAILNFKKREKIPIYIHTNDLMASGAVWSAMAADKIYASYGAMIGNIGVKGPSWFVYNKPMSMNLNFLGPNISTSDGIDFYQPYSGRSKDIFNPFRKPTEEETAKIQKMLDSIYEDFLNIIEKNRKIEKNYIKNNIGALIFDSNTAKMYRLIDNVYDLNKTKKEMLHALNIENDYQILKVKSRPRNIIEEISYIQSNFNNKHENKIKQDICDLYSYQFSLLISYNFSFC